MAKSKKLSTPDLDWQEAWSQASKKQAALVLRAGTECGPILGYSYAPVPEGLTLILGSDLPKNTTLGVFRYKVPVLAEAGVRYPGEPVGLICSSNPAVAQEWLQSFRVIIGSPLTKEAEVPTRSRSLSWGTSFSPEEGDWNFRRSYKSGSQLALDFLPLRVRILSHHQQIWIQAPTQWPKNLLEAVSRVTEKDKEDLVVFPAAGYMPLDSRLWYPSWVAAAAALLHQACGLPVELELTKEEEQAFSPRRPEAEITLAATMSSRGEIKSLEADLVLNTGAQGILDAEILDRLILGLVAGLPVPHLQVRAQCLGSPVPPRGPAGTWGEDITQTALGIFFSELCAQMEEDPAQWIRSRLPIPSETATGTTTLLTGTTLKDPPVLGKLTDHIVRRTDFSRKYSACAALGKKTADQALRFRRGMGFALGFSGTGFIASGTSPASMVMEWNSEKELVIQTSFVPDSSVLAKKWKLQVARELALTETQVKIRPWITAETPDGGPATLGRASILGGRLLSQCVEQLKEKASKNSPFPRRAEKTYRRPLNLPWNSETFQGAPFVAYSWGTAVAEVEWDWIFSRICLRKLTLDIYCGPLEDPEGARTAVLAGVRAALGWCLVENSRRCIRDDEMPEVDLVFHPAGPKSLPRGVGTLPWSIVPPAVLAAAAQATGSQVTHWPLRRQDFPENSP